MPPDDRIYSTFEEFEREEFRRWEAMGATVDEMIDSLFAPKEDVRLAGPSLADDDPEVVGSV